MNQELRDLMEEKDRVQNHLNAVQIEKETLQDRMQMTVSQLNQDIADLHKSIGLQNCRLEDANSREEDLRRQLDHQRDMVQHRDKCLEDAHTEITTLRK